MRDQGLAVISGRGINKNKKTLWVLQCAHTCALVVMSHNKEARKLWQTQTNNKIT